MTTRNRIVSLAFLVALFTLGSPAAADNLIRMSLPNVVVVDPSGEEKPAQINLVGNLEIAAAKLLIKNPTVEMDEANLKTLEFTGTTWSLLKQLFVEVAAFNVSKRFLVDHMSAAEWNRRRTVLKFGTNEVPVWGVPLNLGDEAAKTKWFMTGIRFHTSHQGVVLKVTGTFIAEKKGPLDSLESMVETITSGKPIPVELVLDLGQPKKAKESELDLSTLTPMVTSLNPWERLDWMSTTGDGLDDSTSERRVASWKPPGLEMALWVAQKKNEAQQLLMEPSISFPKTAAEKKAEASQKEASTGSESTPKKAPISLTGCLGLSCGCAVITVGGSAAALWAIRGVFRWFFY